MKTSAKPWSKLRTRVEALWVPSLRMSIHLSVAKICTRQWVFDEPRHWITLDGEIIWDFPRPFMSAAPVRGASIETFEEVYDSGLGRSSVVAQLLRRYLDQPVKRLLEPLEFDRWDLGDILRAADRRLGRCSLMRWASTLNQGSPARRVFTERLPSLGPS